MRTLKSVPDIDLDFAREIREELILRVYERYGHDHAALVCSFATYRLRSAVRDLGKVARPSARRYRQARPPIRRRHRGQLSRTSWIDCPDSRAGRRHRSGAT